MTKTSMGEFLAILRKSKGITQQEAADRLGVSNKTVSSWETGASSPDISMLPAIAELYGVTCDELLRGERISPAEPPQATEQKREKALAHLLARYKNNVSIAALVSYGLAVLAASLFVTLLACRRAVFLVSQDEFEADSTEQFSVYLFRVRGRVSLACAAAFGFIFPHVFIPAYMGLSVGPSFLFGAIGAAAAFLIAGLIYLIVKSKSGHFPENERKFLRFKLINGAVSFGIAALISATAISAVGVYNSAFVSQATVSISEKYYYDSLNELQQDAQSCELFTKYEYSILDVEPLPPEGEGRSKIVYLFPIAGNGLDMNDFYGYNYQVTQSSIEVTLYRYRLEVPDSEGEYLDLVAANLALQNVDLRLDKLAGQYVLLTGVFEDPSPYPNLNPWDWIGAILISAGAFAAATVVYCKRRKKYLAEHPRNEK